MAPATQVFRIPLDRIDTSGRLRPISEAHAQIMAASMREHGVSLTPIEVTPISGDPNFDYRLTFGGHRMRAAEINGETEIDAVVFEVDENNRRLREIDENLLRHELTALDRARFLAERKRIYEEVFPQAKRGGDRRSDQAANLAVWSFAADAAEKTGLSERTIQRACELVARLSPEVMDRVRGTDLADNQAALESLAKHPAERQIKAVELVLAEENPARSVGEAFARLDGKTSKTADDGANLAKFIDTWGRLGVKDRRAILSFLATAELPAGCKVTARGGAQ
jgi:ParB family chromosome partitioning protein